MFLTFFVFQIEVNMSNSAVGILEAVVSAGFLSELFFFLWQITGLFTKNRNVLKETFSNKEISRSFIPMRMLTPFNV